MALGELDIRWTGSEQGDVAIDDEFDEDDPDEDNDERQDRGSGP